MSIIADTLQRLQATKGNSEPKDNTHTSVPSHSSHVKKPKGQTRTSWLKYGVISLAMTAVLGGLGFSAYWAGSHFDFGLLSYGSTQPGIPAVDGSLHLPHGPEATDSKPSVVQNASHEPISPPPEKVSVPTADPQSPHVATIKSYSGTEAQQTIDTHPDTRSSKPSSPSPETHASNPKVSKNPQQITPPVGLTPSLPQPAIPVLPEPSESALPSPVPSPNVVKPLGVTMEAGPHNPPPIIDNLPQSHNSVAEESINAKALPSELFEREEADETSPQSPVAIALHEERVATEEYTSLEADPSPDSRSLSPKSSHSSVKHTSSASPGYPSNPSANRLQTAKELIQQGEYEGAISLLSPVFNDPPVDWEPWFWMGTALLGKGQLDQADQFFLSGMARNDKIPQLWIQRALVAQQRGDFQLAIYELRQAESLDGTLPHIPLNLGYAYEKLGNERLATQYYGKFLKLSEGNPVFFETREKLFARITPQHPLPIKPSGSPAPIQSLLDTEPR